MSHQESTARTAAAVAADLRRIARRLDTVTDATGLFVQLNIQPQTRSDDETIRVTDALGMAVVEKRGSRERMSNGSYHYDVSGHVGSVHVAFFTGISGPETPEMARLRAELAEARAALAARDSRPQMAMETAAAPALPDNAVYWRIYRNSAGSPFVVCMQWFDEADYDQSRFVGEHRYATEAEARADAEVVS